MFKINFTTNGPSIMKIWLTIALMVLFNTPTIFSQVTIKELSLENKIDSIALKPIPYDSLRDFQYQEKFTDYKQYIGLQLFLPQYNNPQGYRQACIVLYLKSPQIVKTTNLGTYITTKVYKPFSYFTGNVNGDNIECICTDAAEIGNKYYTILNVFDQAQFSKIISGMELYLPIKYNDGIKPNYEIPPVTFLIRDDLSKDSLYLTYGYMSRFFLVPYFVKQQQLYNGKSLIAYKINDIKFEDASKGKEVGVSQGSKWKCEVTLLKHKPTNTNYLNSNSISYTLSYILTNANNEMIVLEKLEDNNQYEFITEDEFFKRQTELKENELENKLKQEELVAKRKREEQLQIEKTRIETEKRLQLCINLYGTHFGVLVAQEKVAIGMTKEMCSSAWGKPWDISRTTIENAVFEDWHYGLFNSLHFVNGILKRIED